MLQEINQIEFIKKENEELKEQNEELKRKIQTLELNQEHEELDQLRRKAAIEEIASEARKKLFSWVIVAMTVLGVASISGLLKIYFTTITTIEKRLQDAETLKRIEAQVTAQVARQVSKEVPAAVSKSLIEDFKSDEGFKQNLTSTIADRVLQDSELSTRINATAFTVASTLIQQVAQSDSNPALSTATDKALGQKSYFVITASAKEPSSLQKFTLDAAKQGLKAYLCQPKPGNRRSVILVTNTATPNLTFEAAKVVASKAREGIEPTAYILPTEPADNVFFAPATCKLAAGG